VGQVLWIPGGAGPGPGPGPGQCTHTVQAGENLFRIGLSYGVSVDAIAVANGIVNPNLIYVGQVLSIPGCGQPVPPGDTYVVQPGDTVYGLAARFGVSSWDIITLNNLVNPNLIFVGQVLLIP
jgi:LysM repeat protein